MKMCKTHNPRKIDKCMINLLNYIKKCSNIKSLASCCGHGIYPMTIVIDWMPKYRMEICTDTPIPRKKRFYVKDKQGYYYVPETNKGGKQNGINKI